jgi:hypothetical protein
VFDEIKMKGVFASKRLQKTMALVIKEMQTKTTLRFCLTPVPMAVLEKTSNTF